MYAAKKPTPAPDTNVKQAVPFFRVTNMEKSVSFYADALGFVMTNKWIDAGELKWCWLERGAAAVMLQVLSPNPQDQGSPARLGEGVSICFMCEDAIALYKQFKARGVMASRPFVGNGLWVTTVADPDGYKLEFESPTDVPEDTEYSD